MEGSKEIEELNKKFAEYEGEYSDKEKNLGFELIDPNSLSFESFLGDGTSALVYKGMYKDKKVAIKVLKDSITPQLFSDFKKELRVMSRVRGDMIVGFYGICLRPKFCVLMEYCANGSLFHLMKNPDVRFDWDLTFNLAQQILEALAFLHDSEPQIVHRDLKSLNILITDTYQVKLCDFGLSRQTSRDSKHSDGSQINNTFSTLYNCRGTYVYTAPEVYFKEKMYTDKSDVFSLGVILWELLMRCLTGEYVRPYSEHKNIIMDYQVLIAVAKKGVRPTIPEKAPKSFGFVLKHTWDAEPENRKSVDFLLRTLKMAQGDYKQHKEEWDALLPASSSSSSSS